MASDRRVLKASAALVVIGLVTAAAIAAKLLPGRVVPAADPRNGEAHEVGPEAKGERVKPVGVVRTWGDLLKQPAVELDGGGTVRLGIESLSAPRRSGVLLYCLAEGYRLPSRWKGTNRLGPVRVSVAREEGGKSAGVHAQHAWRPPAGFRASRILFVRAIPIARTGKHHVRLYALDGSELAAATVVGTGDAYHPWMPWAPSHVYALEERADGEYDTVGRVANRRDGVAIPHWNGMMPIAFEGTLNGRQVRKPGSEALPRLAPAKPDGTLTVKLKGKDLLVSSKTEIITARPDWHFLTRWWVNDRPYVPEQMRAYADQNGAVIKGRKLLLRMDFDPGRLGAAKGDKIGLQILYCKHGWRLVLPAHERLAAAMGDWQEPVLLLSNRVDFVAP